MTILGEYTDLKSLLIGQSMVVPSALLQQRPDVAEAYSRGEIEAYVFSLARKINSLVLSTLSRWLIDPILYALRSLPRPLRIRISLLCDLCARCG